MYGYGGMTMGDRRRRCAGGRCMSTMGARWVGVRRCARMCVRAMVRGAMGDVCDVLVSTMRVTTTMTRRVSG